MMRMGSAPSFVFPRNAMKLAYFDCFSGISGDMILGALVDAGCPPDHLRQELLGLNVPGWEIAAEKVWKNGMAATYARVTTQDEQKHRSLAAILEILGSRSLSRVCASGLRRSFDG